MNWWLLIGGMSLMVSAVLGDPWGRSRLAAAMFLAGAAAWIVAVVTA